MSGRRQAFTLIELLVVIAIIAVLISLLVPAVQKVREAAARAQCQNNLKQVALAMHNHHDAHRKLPMGVKSSWAVYGTWQATILPFIEQDALYKNYNFAAGYSDASNLDVTAVRIPTLSCPSDQPATHFPSQITCHNYAANFGNTPVDYNPGAGYDTGHLREFGGIRFGGAPFSQNKHHRLLDMTDGTSNTLLASEVLQGQTITREDLRGFSWWGHGAIFVGYLGPNSTSPDVLYAADYCDNTAPNPPCIGPASATNPVMMGARSRHSGGVNVARGDGSVSFVADGVLLETWRALSSASGGEVANSLD